jgi:SsrA-binding protein
MVPRTAIQKRILKILAKNEKARHDYNVLETFEAGIQLVGTEVKSCRAGNVSLQESYARVEEGELWLKSAHIAEYEAGNRNNHDPKRSRRLLMHKREIRKLLQATDAKGLTIVPLSMYFKGPNIKVELGLCRGKAKQDKRETLKQKIHMRETQQMQQ